MATFNVSGDKLTVTGALGAETERELRDICLKLPRAEGDTVTLDFTKVDHINSVSIGILVALLMDLRDAHKRAVLQPSANLKRILDMTGLTETFAQAAKPVATPRSKSRKAQF
jgi:anti-anti-sigma factor